MDLIADILLTLGAFGAGIYCHVLARRLQKLTDLRKGVGGAVAVLSGQVDEMTTALQNARVSAKDSVERLSDVSQRAEAAASRLELLLASMHDLPEQPKKPMSAFFSGHQQ